MKPINVFINNTKLTEQYCFVIDNRMYYKFNGKYALYELSVIAEKREYAQRLGNVVDHKQVHGLYSGKCPECSANLLNVPVIKPTQKIGFVCYCENCSHPVAPEIKEIQGICNIIDVKTLRLKQMACINYDEIDLEDEDGKVTLPEVEELETVED